MNMKRKKKKCRRHIELKRIPNETRRFKFVTIPIITTSTEINKY